MVDGPCPFDYNLIRSYSILSAIKQLARLGGLMGMVAGPEEAG